MKSTAKIGSASTQMPTVEGTRNNSTLRSERCISVAKAVMSVRAEALLMEGSITLLTAKAKIPRGSSMMRLA